jgi:hypothetical protein
MVEFIQRYNRSAYRLSKHFSGPIFSNSCDNIFGKIRNLGVIPSIDTINPGDLQNS